MVREIDKCLQIIAISYLDHHHLVRESKERPKSGITKVLSLEYISVL